MEKEIENDQYRFIAVNTGERQRPQGADDTGYVALVGILLSSRGIYDLVRAYNADIPGIQSVHRYGKDLEPVLPDTRIFVEYYCYR